ncbi:MAG: class I SAM-dependent methyltransferase [Methylococcaceae bacterium]|nr:class I SAM-dependent methyltransferase [Methylococcaceae bacterium]
MTAKYSIGVEKYTDGEYAHYSPSWHREDSIWKVKQIGKLLDKTQLESLFPNARTLKVIDIGCGAGGVLGNFTHYLSTLNCQVDATGIEPSPGALEIARKDWPDLQLKQLNLLDVQEHFDIGLMIDVVEHVENPWQFVREAASRCSLLIFHIPLDDSLLTELASLYHYKAQTMGHIHFFTRQKALWFLDSCGLNVLGHRFTQSFNVPSSLEISSKHKLLALPRRVLASVSPSACSRLLGGMSLMVVAQVKK